MELIFVAAATSALIGAVMINEVWVGQHFLPDYFRPHSAYLAWATAARVALVMIAVVLVFLRGPAGRLAERHSLRSLAMSALPMLVAFGMALVVTELVLRSTFWRVAAEAPASPEPKVRPDPRLGWTLAPSRTALGAAGRRTVEYAFDASGYRVPRPDAPPDPDRPTILFGGESIIVGYGLTWDESIPAQVQSIMGVQCANAAVVGYATDQAYLRLQSELPRFHKPVAVVMLFTPALMAKNLSEARPHLSPDLVPLPPRQMLRLQAIAMHAVPYHSRAAIDRGVAMTQSVLRAFVDMTRSRGAIPLIVTPVYGEEEPAARALRRRVLDEAGLPYVLVRLDPSWRIPGDGHPDARGAHAIAVAIAARLAAAAAPPASSNRADAPARIDPNRAGTT